MIKYKPLDNLPPDHHIKSTDYRTQIFNSLFAKIPQEQCFMIFGMNIGDVETKLKPCAEILYLKVLHASNRGHEFSDTPALLFSDRIADLIIKSMNDGVHNHHADYALVDLVYFEVEINNIVHEQVIRDKINADLIQLSREACDI